MTFGLSLSRVSLLGATSVIANSLFSPLFGYFSDRFGLKYFIVAGPLVAAIFLSLLGIIPNYWLILGVLFMGNLGIASYHPASAAIAGHYGGNKKGFSSSLINFGGNFGSAFGALLVILILDKIGINYTPFAMIPGIIMVIILFKYMPGTQTSVIKTDSGDFFKKLKSVKPVKLFLLANLVITVYALYILWISLINYMPLYLTEAGVPIISIGIVLFLFGTIGGGAGFLSGILYDRFKKGNVLLQSCLAISIPILYLMFLPGNKIIVTIALFITAGIFLVAIQPVGIRMSQDLLPGNISLASSLMLGLSSGLAGVTMIFLGKVADRIGIARLLRLELIFLIIAFIVLFSYPALNKKLSRED